MNHQALRIALYPDSKLCAQSLEEMNKNRHSSRSLEPRLLGRREEGVTSSMCTLVCSLSHSKSGAARSALLSWEHAEDPRVRTKRAGVQNDGLAGRCLWSHSPGTQCLYPGSCLEAFSSSPRLSAASREDGFILEIHPSSPIIYR